MHRTVPLSHMPETPAVQITAYVFRQAHCLLDEVRFEYQVYINAVFSLLADNIGLYSSHSTSPLATIKQL